MAGSMAHYSDFLRIGWLTGPILDRELLVASRRLRYYLLRTAYVLLLCLMLSFLWIMTWFYDDKTSAVYRVNQMSAIARQTCGTVMWFQFISLQLLAIVMLGNSISDEIRKRTLDVLASTPITSLQIVLGKLASRLLQIVLLLAVSFPFLAIIRSFGGIPWVFVAGGLAVTLTATVFAGAITVMLSVRNRQAYRSVVGAFLLLLFIYAAPLAAAEILRTLGGIPAFLAPAYDVYIYMHPFVAMAEVSRSLVLAQPVTFNWQGHCMAVLGVSVLVLGYATLGLRRAIYSAVTGASEAGSVSPLKRLSLRAFIARSRQRRPVMRVIGHPIVWKDLAKDSNALHSVRVRVCLIIVLGLAYAGAYAAGWLAERWFHAAVTGFIVLVGLVRTGALAAASIASEKDARAWPILLSTPLDGREIFRAKVTAIARRVLPLWIFLLVHLVVFMLAGVLDWLNIVSVVFIVAPAVILLVGIGVFFGLRLRTQTGAFVATFAVPIALWFMCPCIGYVSNPILMAAMAVAVPMSLSKVMASSGGLEILIPAAFVIVPSMVYLIAGLIFAVSAANTIRRNPF
jgi:ABC-type transport system involved in multi-copper enzyme maturation permease subunit